MAELAQVPPGGATTRQSPRCQTHLDPGDRDDGRAVAGRALGDDVGGRGARRVGGQPVGGFDGIAPPGGLARWDVGGGAQGGVVAVVGGQQGCRRPGR